MVDVLKQWRGGGAKTNQYPRPASTTPPSQDQPQHQVDREQFDVFHCWRSALCSSIYEKHSYEGNLHGSGTGYLTCHRNRQLFFSSFSKSARILVRMMNERSWRGNTINGQGRTPSQGAEWPVKILAPRCSTQGAQLDPSSSGSDFLPPTNGSTDRVCAIPPSIGRRNNCLVDHLLSAGCLHKCNITED